MLVSSVLHDPLNYFPNYAWRNVAFQLDVSLVKTGVESYPNLSIFCKSPIMHCCVASLPFSLYSKCMAPETNVLKKQTTINCLGLACICACNIKFTS